MKERIFIKVVALSSNESEFWDLHEGDTHCRFCRTVDGKWSRFWYRWTGADDKVVEAWRQQALDRNRLAGYQVQYLIMRQLMMPDLVGAVMGMLAALDTEIFTRV